jgi:hypothetical protein
MLRAFIKPNVVRGYNRKGIMVEAYIEKKGGTERHLQSFSLTVSALSDFCTTESGDSEILDRIELK